MSSSLFRLSTQLIAALLCLASAATPAFASDPAPSPNIPLEAALIGSLQLKHLKEGSPVVAMALREWTSGDCHLAPGAFVHGHISSIVPRSKTNKTSSFQIDFDRAECKGAAPELPLTLIGLIGPLGDPPIGQSGLTEAPPLTDVPALAIGINTSANPNNPPAMLRSVGSASDINTFAMVVQQTRKLPTHILPGQVIDVPRTDLHVGVGANGASVISAVNRDVSLDPKTVFILVPAAILRPLQRQAGLLHDVSRSTNPAAATSAAAPAAIEAPAVSPEPPDMSEICSGDCNVLGSFASRALNATHPSATLSLATLGYAPHNKQRALSFNHETTVTYLDSRHLLCTFDPHALRSRTGKGEEPLRGIRAVLIDPLTRSVIRVMDWRVRGEDAYLWRYGQNQILVHMEHELRLFNDELVPVRSIPVEGPVKWIASSPSTDHIAVGVLKHRYSMDEYSFYEKNGLAPEQDLEVRVYDHDWNLLSVSLRSSSSPEPVLSDGGELRVSRGSSGHWKISEYGWDKSVHDLATVRSICRPLISAPESGLVFVTGCMATTNNIWYRMLRRDGHPLLKAESGADEIVQSAEGATDGEFAVRVIKTAKDLGINQPFNRDDVVKEEIAVYRASDGKRISSVVTDDFILSQHSYALSPAGAQMAVVGASAIFLYNIAAQP